MLDFPSSPSDGQAFGGFQWSASKGVWKPAPIQTAEPYNLFVNPSMDESLENGSTSGSVNGYCVADQWHNGTVKSGIPSPGDTPSFARVALTTPRGSAYRAGITFGAYQRPTLPAGDYVYWYSNIEGYRVARLLWGTANANQAVIRFGFRGPAGTYTLSIRNPGGARTYLADFTISAGQAGVDTEQVIVIPATTTGTWPTTNVAAITFGICVACGTTLQGAPGWGAASCIATANTTNGWGIGSAVFHIFDLGFYVDPFLTGKAPPWQRLKPGRNARDCRRYFWKTGHGVGRGLAVSATSVSRCGGQQPVEVRAAPALSVYGTTTFWCPGSTNNAMSVSSAYPGTSTWEFDGVSSGMAPVRNGINLGTAGGVNINARM